MVTDESVLLFFRKELSTLGTWYFKKIPLKLDTVLQDYALDTTEFIEAIEKYDEVFGVDVSKMNWESYYPWKIEWFYRRWLTNKPLIQNKKPLTVKTFAESARAGKWLQD
mgnify:CR=1 FL=1